MIRGNLARTGTVPCEAGPTARGLQWVFKPGKAGVYASPAVVGNRVYISTARPAVIGNGRGEIVCLDADTGSVTWRAAPPGYRAAFSSPVIAGNRLVCGEGLHQTQDARVICTVVAGASAVAAPFRRRDRWFFFGEKGLMTVDANRLDEPPEIWADTTWVGRPTTPVVLCRSSLYMGMAGWGLVRWGEGL